MVGYRFFFLSCAITNLLSERYFYPLSSSFCDENKQSVSMWFNVFVYIEDTIFVLEQLIRGFQEYFKTLICLFLSLFEKNKIKSKNVK